MGLIRRRLERRLRAAGKLAPGERLTNPIPGRVVSIGADGLPFESNRAEIIAKLRERRLMALSYSPRFLLVFSSGGSLQSWFRDLTSLRSETKNVISIGFSGEPELVVRWKPMWLSGKVLVEQLTAARAAAVAGLTADEYAESAFRLGVFADKDGDVDGAREAWTTALASNDPATSARAAMNLGMLVKRAGDIEAARAFFEQAAGSGTDLAGLAQINLGQVQRELGEVDAAADAFIRLSSSDDREVAARAALGLGNTLWQVGDTDGARNAFERAIASRHPAVVPGAAYQLGRLCTELRDYRSATGAFRLVLESGAPENIVALARVYLGEVYRHEGDLHEAIQSFRCAADAPDPEVAALARARLADSLQTPGE